MTLDLSTTEGRAELREAMWHFAKGIPDHRGSTTSTRPGYTMLSIGNLSAIALTMLQVLDALEAAHATIERLTAPVMDAEVLAMAELYNGSPVNDASDLYDMRGLLDAFIARRKEQAP